MQTHSDHIAEQLELPLSSLPYPLAPELKVTYRQASRPVASLLSDFMNVELNGVDLTKWVRELHVGAVNGGCVEVDLKLLVGTVQWTNTVPEEDRL